MAHAQAQILEIGEDLRAGDLMDQVQTNEQLGGTSGQLGERMAHAAEDPAQSCTQGSIRLKSGSG